MGLGTKAANDPLDLSILFTFVTYKVKTQVSR